MKKRTKMKLMRSLFYVLALLLLTSFLYPASVGVRGNTFTVDVEETDSLGLYFSTDTVEVITYYDMYMTRWQYFKQSEFCPDLLKEYLSFRNMRNADVVLAQALLETGFFTSPIFFENNNLFGMKYPLVRNTTATHVSRGHAAYSHWTSSVEDYILWYSFMTRSRDYNTYTQFLAQIGYAEDPYYLSKLYNLLE